MTITYGLLGEGVALPIGAMICLLAAPRDQLFAAQTTNGRIMCIGISQSADTSETVKRNDSCGPKLSITDISRTVNNVYKKVRSYKHTAALDMTHVVNALIIL